jgi:putative ABC transport system permease protein
MNPLDTLLWALTGCLVFFAALALLLFFLGKVPVSYNARNLLVRWRITLMTGAIFILTSALLVVMLAFVNGMYELTKGSGRPGNVIILADGATDELFSNLGYGDIETLPRKCPGTIQDDQGRLLASWEVYASVLQPIPTRTCPVCGKKIEVERISPSEQHLKEHGDPHCAGSGAAVPMTGPQRRFIQVRGLVDPVIAGEVHRLDLYPGGQWFSAAGADNEGHFQCVLGEGIAHVLGQDRDKKSLEVGDVFSLRDRPWVVTGVLHSVGSAFDSEIWCKQQIVADLFGKNNYTTGVLRTPDDATAQALVKDATDNFKTPAVLAQTESAYYEKLNGTNQVFLWGSIVVVAIMAIGSVFGVMNAMFAAISQRTSDIGVLRILGYKRLHVLISFFLETLLLALIGGLIGCALGSLCNGWTANSIVSSGQGGGKSVVFQLVVSPLIISGGLGFSVLMGALGGLLPALSAMRMKPLESLR